MTQNIKRRALVFLHGTMCDERLFAPQIARFAGAWRVIAPAVKWRDGGLAALAANMLSLLPSRFALAGLSLGGIVALEILRQEPGRVSHLALLNTNDGADSEAGRAMREADFAQAEREGLEAFMRREMIPRYLHKDNLCRKEISQTVADMALSCGMAGWRGQLELLKTRRDARALLAQTKAPILIACGEQDRICPPALHREMAAAATTTAEIYSGSGHLSTLEAPEAVNESLARLLAV